MASPEDQKTPHLHLYVTNIQSAFDVGCKLDLNRIAQEAYNVEKPISKHQVRLCLKKPFTTYIIFKSGKIVGMGATNELEAYTGARRVARILQRLNFNISKISNFRISNIMALCPLPYHINLIK